MEFCSTSVDPKMPSVDVPNRNPKCAHEQGRTLSAAMAGMGLVTTKAMAQEGAQSGHEHAEIWDPKPICRYLGGRGGHGFVKSLESQY